MIVRLIIVCLVGIAGLPAAQYYVSPSGTDVSNGSILTPWSLQFALTNAGIANGDAVWLREGTYSNLFTSNISSTASNAPITFRNYNSERAIIDGRLTLNNSTSSNIWFWGLEVIDSNKASRTEEERDTISNGGLGVKFINCLIHDCMIGLAGGAYEAYGNIMWHCGKSANQHGIYWQNSGTIPKLIENNLIGWASAFGIHCYSESGFLNNLQIIGNIIWESGQPLNDRKSNILLGGGTSITNGLINGNDSFMLGGGRGIEIGYSIETNYSIVVVNNRSYASRALWVHQPFNTMTVTNNTIMQQGPGADGLVIVSDATPFSDGPYTWDYNTYYNARPDRHFDINGTYITFAQWTNSPYGFDTHGNYNEADYDTSGFLRQVTVRTNRYELKRAHIVVWNFGQSNVVTADVSGVLTAGDSYEVRSALNYFGGVVVAGTYAGGSITLPMTNLTAASVLYATNLIAPVLTSPGFAAFVVTGTAAEAGSTIINATTANIGIINAAP